PATDASREPDHPRAFSGPTAVPGRRLHEANHIPPDHRARGLCRSASDLASIERECLDANERLVRVGIGLGHFGEARAAGGPGLCDYGFHAQSPRSMLKAVHVWCEPAYSTPAMDRLAEGLDVMAGIRMVAATVLVLALTNFHVRNERLVGRKS